MGGMSIESAIDPGGSSRIVGSSGSLKALAVRGSIWTMTGYGASQVLRLGSNLVLAWLLFPEAFGLMALVNVFMRGLAMFSDIGIRPSIIQNKRGDDPEFLNTAWTIQIIRGVVLWICACILAWPFAWLFSRNDASAWQLTALIPVTGVIALLGGFASTSIATLNRRIHLGRLTILQLSSSIVKVVVMVVWALVSPTVWAFVAGGLAQAVFRLIMSHLWLADTKNYLHWDRDCARELFRFGKWIFVSTAITFLAMQADRLLLGNLVPLGVLGVYSIGLVLASVPRELVNRVTRTVLFPALAKQRRQSREAFPEKVRAARNVILPVAVLALLGVVLLAPSFFRVLYDERYHDAGWMAQLLCIAVWIGVLKSTADRALLALGNSRVLAFSNFANLVAVAVGCVVGYLMFGLPGFILGYSISSLAGYVVIAHAAHRVGIAVVRQDLMYTSLLVCLAALGILIPAAFSQVVSDTHLQGAIVVGWSMLLLLGCGIWAFRRVAPVVWIR